MIFIIKFSGHRGYKAKEIENTKAAVLRAIEEKLDYIEIDVRKASDDNLVIFHNRKINKLLDGRGSVHNYSLRQLKSFQYKDGQKILTFEELLDLTKGKIKLIIDVKSKEIEKKIISMISKYEIQKEVIIQSFLKTIIKKCQKIAPDLDYAIYRAFVGNLGKVLGKGLRLHKLTAPLFYRFMIKKIPVKYVSLDGPFMYDEFISILNTNGLNIILGAMKTKKYLKNTEKWNIKIINCDNPEEIKKLRDASIK